MMSLQPGVVLAVAGRICPMARPLRVMISDSPRSSWFNTAFVSWCNLLAVIVLTEKK